MSLSPYTIFAIIIYSFTLFYIPYIVLFYYRSSYSPPIQRRTPLFNLILNVSMYFIGLNEIFAITFSDFYPQVLRGLLGSLPTITAFYIYICRLVHLLFSFKINEHITQHEEQQLQQQLKSTQPGGETEMAIRQTSAWDRGGISGTGHSSTSIAISTSSGVIASGSPSTRTRTISQIEKNWYNKHQYMSTPKFLLTILLIQYIILLTYYFIIVALTPGMWNGFGRLLEPTRPYQSIFWTSLMALCGVYLILCLILMYLLRNCTNDVFKIKVEMRAVGCASGIGLLVTWVIYSLNLPREVPVLPILIVLHAVYLLGTVWPYYISKQEELKMKQAKPETNLTLLELLQTPEGFQAFSIYLQSEFSSENLVFWEKVELLKSFTEPDTIKEAVDFIFNTFITPEAPYRVTIPHEIRETTCQAVQNLQENDFSPFPPQPLPTLPLSSASTNTNKNNNTTSTPSSTPHKNSDSGDHSPLHNNDSGHVSTNKDSSITSTSSEMGLYIKSYLQTPSPSDNKTSTTPPIPLFPLSHSSSGNYEFLRPISESEELKLLSQSQQQEPGELPTPNNNTLIPSTQQSSQQSSQRSTTISTSLQQTIIPTSLQQLVASNSYNEQDIDPDQYLTSNNIEDWKHVFDVAQKNVYDSLANDSYLRFQNLSPNENVTIKLVPKIRKT